MEVRMINSEKDIERRFYERFQVQQGVYALVRNGSSKLGQIKNISKGGLAFMYINDEQQMHEPSQVDIFLSGYGFILKGIACKKISDIHIENFVPFSTFEMRQLGIQFIDVNLDQSAQLDMFIEKYATRSED